MKHVVKTHFCVTTKKYGEISQIQKDQKIFVNILDYGFKQVFEQNFLFLESNEKDGVLRQQLIFTI